MRKKKREKKKEEMIEWKKLEWRNGDICDRG